MAPIGDDPTQLAFTVDTGDLETGFAKAGAQLEQFKAVVNSGKGNFVGLGAAVSETIATIEARLASMKASGVSATDAQVVQLQKLKIELESTTVQAGKAAAAKQQYADKMRAATADAGEFKGSVLSTTDALKNMAPELAGRIQGLSMIAAKFLLAAKAAQVISGAARELFVDGSQNGKEWDAQLTSLDKTISAVFSLDVVGVVKNFGSFVGETFNNLTDATQTLTDVNEDAAASYELLGSKGTAAVERMRGILALTREILADRAKEKQSLDDRASALERIARMELESGAVSEATRRDIKATIDAYDEEKRAVLPGLQEIIAKLGLQSSAQEDAAEKAEDKARRHADAVRSEVDALEGSLQTLQERTRLHLEAVAAVEKDGVVTAATSDAIRAKNAELVEAWKRYGAEVPAELQAVTDKYPELAKATDTAAEAQKRLQDAARAANDELRAQADEAERAAQDAEKSLADKKARLAELDKKGATGLLSGDESNEAFDLRGQIAREERAVQEARQRSAAAADDLAAAEAGLAGAQGVSADQAAKLEAIETALAAGLITTNEAFSARLAIAEENLGITSDLAAETERLARAGEDAGGAYRAATRDMATFSTEQGRAVETAERFGETFVRTMEDGSTRITNFEGEIGVLQDGLERAGEAGSEAISGIADEAERAREAVAGAASEAGKLADPATLDPYLTQLQEADKLWASIVTRIGEANRLTAALTDAMGDENDTGPAPAPGGSGTEVPA